MLTGGSNYTTSRSLSSFSLATKKWTRLGDLPSGRFYHGSVVLNNSLYLVGGVGNRNIDKYDASTETFATVKSMETERSRFGACKCNDDSLIVAGGYMNGSTQVSCTTPAVTT